MYPFGIIIKLRQRGKLLVWQTIFDWFVIETFPIGNNHYQLIEDKDLK